MIIRAVRVWRSAKLAEKNKTPLDLNSQELAFLPAALEVLETPISGGIRLIPALIMMSFAMAILFTVVTQIDVVATATGTLLPSTKVKPIQPKLGGYLSAVYVSEGNLVNAGDLLVSLDTVEIVEEMSERSINIESAQLDLKILLDFNKYLASGQPIALEDAIGVAKVSPKLLATYQTIYLDTLWTYNHDRSVKLREIELLRLDIEQLEVSLTSMAANRPLESLKYENAQSLYAMKSLSFEKWLSADKAFRTFNESIRNQESQLKNKQIQLKNKESDYQDIPHAIRVENNTKIASLEADLTKLEFAMREAQRKLDDSDIRAPENGTVQNISLVVPGQSVSAGSSVMDLVPSMDYLVAEIDVNNKDIGFVEIGQEVIVKFDALPYTKYGHLAGTIVNLARDSVEGSDGSKRYKALVKLPTQVMTTIERDVELMPGMTVSAEIKLSRRRVIEYFLSTFKRYKSESIREQ